MNHSKVILDYLVFWDEFDGNLAYFLFSSETGNILDSKESSSTTCYNSQQCCYLYIIGNGNYQILRQNKVFKKGEIFDDNPFILQLGECNEEFQCSQNGYTKQMIFISKESELSVREENTLISKKVFPYNNTSELKNRNVPSLQKICMNPEFCYRASGSAAYLEINETSSVVGQGNTLDGDQSFGKEIQCFSKCSENPRLAETSRGRNIVLAISSISSMSVLSNTSTPNYMAACWIIYEDSKQLDVYDHNLIQRYILTLLFFETNGDKWKRNLGFLSSFHECQWNKPVLHDRNELYQYYDGGIEKIYHYGGDGVHCDALNHVVGLKFSSNNLAGRIIPEISWLSQIELLDFGYNLLSGTIPSILGDFEKIKHIILESNVLTGTIPSLRKLENLQTLRLGANLLSGIIPNIHKGNNLAYLNFAKNKLSSFIPEEIGELASLTFFSVFDNQLNGSLPENFNNISKVQYLDLGLNSFTGTIPSLMLNFPNAYKFWLDSNYFSGTMPSQMRSNIAYLYMNDNLLTGSIPSQISNLPNLKSLYLQNNKLSGEIPQELYKLNNLTEFFIQKNNITGTIAIHDCDKFTSLEADCDSPQKVICECCKKCHGIFIEYDDDVKAFSCPSTEVKIIFKDADRGALLNSFLYTAGGALLERNWHLFNESEKTHITCVSSSDCFRLYIDTLSSPVRMLIFANQELIIDEMVLTPKMEFFFGYSKRFGMQRDECDDLTLCNSIGLANTAKRDIMNKLVRVTGLEKLSQNSSLQYKSLCDWMTFLTKFDENMMGKSELLQGFILAMIFYSTGGINWFNSSGWLSNYDICSWYGLECDDYGLVSEINLGSNNLKGTIPTEIRELRGLSKLILEENHLAGSLPITIGLLDLDIIKLSKNELSRSIPSEIGFLSSLTELDLSHNIFTNTIPLEFGRLTNLIELNLYNNSLAGVLLHSFFNLTSLSFLSLGNNFLVGNLVGLDRFTNIEFLDLSHNFFTGTIPLNLKQKSTRILRLSGNEFVGTIPTVIGKMLSLQELMLQNNRLSGSVPTHLGLLRDLQQLSISYNGFKGTIPIELRDLNKIKLLHLHRNQLHGDADIFPHNIDSFITDCGSQFMSPALIRCKNCTTCCNSDGYCIHLNSTWPPQVIQQFSMSYTTFFVLSSILCSCILCAILCILLCRCFRKFGNIRFLVSSTFQQGSAYRFLLCSSKIGFLIAFITVGVQLYILRVFTSAADITSLSNDWTYSLNCGEDALSCDDSKNITTMGIIIFGFIIFIFLLKDLFEGILMICESDATSSLKGMFAGFIVTFVTCSSIVVSTLYNLSTGISDTDMLKDAVILLFLNDIDEQMFELVSRIAPIWLEKNEIEISYFLQTKIQKFYKVHGKKDSSEDTREYHESENENYFDEEDQPGLVMKSKKGGVNERELSLCERINKLEDEVNEMRKLLESLSTIHSSHEVTSKVNHVKHYIHRTKGEF